MTEHHGFDLDAIEATGHSVFAPSGSAMWLICSGSLLPNLAAEDDAGADAAYGTVGHEVGETWLKAAVSVLEWDSDAGTIDEVIDFTEPVELVGQTRPVVERSGTYDILIDAEMLAYVRQYVKWCLDTPGDRYTERRVYFGQLTPIPGQGGRADFAVCQTGLLEITDLKMGKGEQVFAAHDIEDPRTLVPEYEGGMNGNSQALIYALGFFYEYDERYHFERIRVRIAQPRLDHFETWETTREELLKFAEFVRERAALAWVVDAPRTPSKKGCRWCKVRKNCTALKVWLDSAIDGVFDPVDEMIEGTFTVVSDSFDMAVAKNELNELPYDPQPPMPGEMTTGQMAKLLPMRSLIETWFAEMQEELERRANAGETIPGFKLVEGRESRRKWLDEEDARVALEFIGLLPEEFIKSLLVSPAQAEEALKAKYRLTKKAAAALVNDLTNREPGRKTLVPLTDRREELEDVGTVFDDVSDDGGI